MKAFGKAYENIEAANGGNFKKLPAGGYIAEIKAVEDVPAKEYLKVIYDIATGEFKGIYSDDWGKDHPYAHCMYWSYKEANKKYFKANMAAVDKTNLTDFNEQLKGKTFDEKQLVGQRLGLVIGYEEYRTDRGEIRQRTYVAAVRSGQAIGQGDFTVPELKRLEDKMPSTGSPVAGFEQVNEEDLPF